MCRLVTPNAEIRKGGRKEGSILLRQTTQKEKQQLNHHSVNDYTSWHSSSFSKWFLMGRSMVVGTDITKVVVAFPLHDFQQEALEGHRKCTEFYSGVISRPVWRVELQFQVVCVWIAMFNIIYWQIQFRPEDQQHLLCIFLHWHWFSTGTCCFWFPTGTCSFCCRLEHFITVCIRDDGKMLYENVLLQRQQEIWTVYEC